MKQDKIIVSDTSYKSNDPQWLTSHPDLLVLPIDEMFSEFLKKQSEGKLTDHHLLNRISHGRS
ncbi:hypothetical protein [Chryseobacterium sp. c4a]|uniref:hypothetical protein n=1 Tax=Chryseobacterium sp. c4a TaxID=1573582 RepID=UPI00135C8765|nr:hypothetical protein [Chryseobacterium sp. c4a]